MEENEKNETKFKAIPVTGSSSYNKNEKSQKNKTGFGKTVILPFVSGVVGCSVVLNLKQGSRQTLPLLIKIYLRITKI